MLLIHMLDRVIDESFENVFPINSLEYILLSKSDKVLNGFKNS